MRPVSPPLFGISICVIKEQVEGKLKLKINKEKNGRRVLSGTFALTCC